MINRKRIYKISAFLLILALLLGMVGTSENEVIASAEAGAVYSDWLRLNELPESQDAQPGALGLRQTLNENRSAQGQSSNLADFLTGINISGADLNSEGQYVIHAGVPYTVQMNFSEIVNGLQFDNDGVWSYTFPNGFTPLPTSGRFNIGGENDAVWLDYAISGDTLTVTVDRTQSPGYQSFLIAENVNFQILADGIINKSEIEFSSEVTGRFHIDESSNVSVRKVGTYDAALNKIKFTIQAYSTGKNTNVHIGDTITGTALTLDPSSMTVSSNVQSGDFYTLAAQQNEFDVTIPRMSHGEVVTVEYYVDVDLGELKNLGITADTTGNKVNIISDNDPTPEEHEIFVNQIALSSNSKTASSQTVRDGKTYVTWTIVLNENANMSIAGSEVTDTIDSSSQQYMRYSGSGIHIERYQKDGTSAGSSDVAWGTNGLSASQGGSTWTYTIPEADEGHSYKYVITYETEVDSNSLLQTTAVSNHVHNEYDNDYSGTSIDSTGEEVKAEKTAVSSNVDALNKTAETEWEITFTVPPAGLDSAVITDTMPGFLDYANMVWFYDAYKEGSVRIEDGDLLPGEGFTVESMPDSHQVAITFNKNGQPGLIGNGLSRTIHVYLTTTANPAWLRYAETESRARTHVNNAVVRLNGQDMFVTGSVSYNTTAYDLKKRLDSTAQTNTDPALPIYVYRIILSNVDDSAFDPYGFITITDDYDSGHLSVFDPSSTDYESNLYGYVFGIPSWDDSLIALRRSTDQAVASSDEGQIVFKLDRNDLPMSGTAYYPKYVIVYALQVKDAETLERMKEEALHSDGLSVKMTNIAANSQFGTDEFVTEYSIEALKKTKLSEEDNGSTGTHDIQFQIEVNPEALKIGDEDMITVKDTISNLSFDYTSITIDPVIPGDTLNRVGNSIIFTLQNETSYVITYTARLIGFQDVDWNNTAVLYGYESGVNGTSSAHSSGSGGFSTYSMHVKKYAEGDMNHGLAATFEIYEARVKDSYGNSMEAEWKKVGEFTTDGSTGVYQIESVVREGSEAAASLRQYSYHENGMEKFGDDGSDTFGWRYRVIETVAPVGYQKTTAAYEFGISDLPSYIAPYNYLNGDTVTIVNKPMEMSVDTVIPGQKVLVGKELENQEFSFTLSPEESAKEAWGEGYPGGFDGTMTVKNNAEGHFSFTLSFTYDDYLTAEQKGFVDDSDHAYFYYIVTEDLPEGAEDRIWNSVRYDESKFLAVVELFVDGGKLKTKTKYYHYDGTIPDELMVWAPSTKLTNLLLSRVR